MATEIIMPKVDMVMETGTFVEWLKEEGAPVQKGEPLFVIVTDKANIEIEAPASGTLAGLRARPDEVIPVTQVIGYVLAPGEALPAGGGGAAVPGAPAAPAAPEARPSPAGPPGIKPSPGTSGKVRATPAARRIADDLGVNLAALGTGRGPRGRIHTADVLAAAERPPAAAAARAGAAAALPITLPAVRLPDARRSQLIPLAGPRKIIAERMAFSAANAPHITLSLRVDMSEASRLRTRVQESIQQKTGHRLSFTAIIARAVAAVLPRHAYLNASLQDDRISLWEDVHLGVATSMEDYLIVPVIREAQAKSLERIVSELGDLVERARARRLTPVEMSGSTFTISNLGMFGIESFTAIINPPETAILAVGQIVDTPVSAEGQVVLRPMMALTLSADHRVVDGVGAARFLAELKATLENPYLLI